MDRRTALKRVGLGMGYTVSLPTLVSLFQSCNGSESGEAAIEVYKPEFFNKSEYDLLGNFLDLILPQTETPGALDVGAMKGVDTYLSKVYNAEDQGVFRKGFETFTTKLQSDFGLIKNEEGLEAGSVSPENWTKFADQYIGEGADVDEEKLGNLLGTAEEDVPEADKDTYYLYNFFASFKELGISSYFASEVIASEHLSYDPIPGEFKGCIPLDEVGNSWSINH